MHKENLAFLKISFSFFVWSLLGPILNLSTFTVMQNIWGISVLGLFYLIIYAFYKHKLQEVKKVKFNISLLLFMFASGISGVLWLNALTLMPIAQAILLYSTGPFFALVLGYMFLKEKIYLTKLLAIALGIIGIAIILSGNYGGFSFGSKYFFGIVTIFIAAFLTASQAVITRKYSFDYPTWINVLIIMVSQIIITTPLILTQHWNITPFAMSSLFFLSYFSSIVAFFFYVDSLRYLQSSSVLLIGYIEPLLVSIWGHVFLKQPLTTFVAMGGALILLAGYLTVSVERKRK